MDVYIETSALNFFRGMLADNDALATRDLQNERGRRWVWSPVTIWEVLLTRQVERKESLISLAQHLLDRELLPSPEEMLVKYLEQGCPLNEKPRPLVSAASLAETWRDVSSIPDKTFIVDDLYVRSKTRALAKVMKDLHRLLRQRTIALTPYTMDSSYDITLEQVVGRLRFLKDGAPPDDYHKSLYKTAVFYVLFLLCTGVGLHPEGVEPFWKSRKISKTVDRLMYVLDQHEEIVYRGPIAQMAMMTVVQSTEPYSRGMFWDSLHAFYLTYVSVLFAEDSHFAQLRTRIGDHPNAEKILKPSSFRWESTTRAIEQASFIAT